MTQNKILKTNLIIFIFLVSLFSTCLTGSYPVKAGDGLLDDSIGDDISETLNLYKQLIINEYKNIYGEDLVPNPFKYIGVWDYSGNETYLDGDITLELYFSSTLLTQLPVERFEDSVNVSVFYLDDLGKVQEIKNATKKVTLTPDIAGGRIQKITIKLENVNYSFTGYDTLFFVLEIDQSEKIINNYVAKQYENKIKPLTQKIADALNNSKNETISEAGVTIKEILDILDQVNINGDDVGELANVLRSSAFYYGSDSYKSKIKFSTSDNEDHNLYFYNTFSDFDPSFKVINETEPVSDRDYSYPPIVNPADLTSTEDGEWLDWLLLWIVYNTEGATNEINENKIVYYLHDEDKMDASKPSESNSAIRKKLSDSALKWTGDKINRNKIIKNITVNLYVQYSKLLTLRKPTVKVSIYDNDKEIASDEIKIDRAILIEMLKRGPNSPTTFYFNLNHEIFYDHSLRLEVSGNKPLLILKPLNLLYDSEKYPSSMTIYYNETDNIKVDGVTDKLVYAGGSAEYELTIASKYKDTVTLEVDKNSDKFEVYYYPKTVSIDENSSAKIHVFVNSTATDDSAYGDEAEVYFNASGNTGFTSKKSNIKVSEDAVKHGIDVIVDGCLKIKHGHNKTYTFKIRNSNTGFIKDRYSINVTSEHNFSLSYLGYVETDTPGNYLDVYNESNGGPEAVVNVTISVPWYTDINSDKLTFIISSEHSGYEYSVTVNVTTEIEGANIFENIYHLFETAADEMGLNDALEGYGTLFLIFLILFLIIFFLIIAIVLARRKFVELICLDRIKEISPDEIATYEMTLRNPCKRNMTYDIFIETKEDMLGNRWEVSLDKQQVYLDPRKSEIIILTVKPSDYVKADDWVEVKVVTKPSGMNKTAEVTTVTTIKDQKINLKISGVVHWPRYFKKGDKVETSFKLTNRGNVSAENVTVILYVNGEEKNRVENITIPRGGFADIEIPWIAGKGKNEVNIVVK